jgi:hypothetical protein
MIDAASVAALLRPFDPADDGEAAKSKELVLALLASSPEPFSRRQFNPGHITCTGLVLSPSRDRILLVLHRRLQRWLLPGGHDEPFHLHHDLIFRFHAATDSFHTSEEVREVAWCSVAEFDRYQLPGSIRRSFARALGHP